MTHVSRCDARLKVILATAALIVAVGARYPGAPLLLAAAVLTAYSSGGAPLRPLLRVLARAALSIAVPMLVLGLFHGPAISLLWATRVASATLIGFWLAATTPFVQLQAASVWLHVPSPILELLGLAQRYVGVFGDTLRTAREAQTLRLGYATTARGLQSLGVLGGLVLRRALIQTTTLADAMEMRAYCGRLWLPRSGRFRRCDAPAALLGGAVLLVAGALAW